MKCASSWWRCVPGLLIVALAATADGSEPMRLMDWQDDQARVASAEAGKALGFISTQSPHCYQPDRAANACHINFHGNSVSSDQYVTRFEILVDGLLVADVRGFFQSSFVLTRDTLGPHGISLPCGVPGASGQPDLRLGWTYQITLRARDSAGQTSANYASVSCPAYFPDEIFADGFED